MGILLVLRLTQVSFRKGSELGSLSFPSQLTAPGTQPIGDRKKAAAAFQAPGY